MDENYLKALTGTLRSTYNPDPDPPNSQTITVNNDLPIPLLGRWIDSTGRQWVLEVIFPVGQEMQAERPLPNGVFIIWTDVVQGAFVGLSKLDFSPPGPGTTLLVDPTLMLGPGDIGPIPKPNKEVLLPDASMPVVVGAGSVVNGYMIRTQYYRCTDNSFALPPGDQRVLSVTTSSGRQTVSSDLETVSKSMSVSSTAGWGPISASASYSLSQSSTTFQQYTITEESTRFDEVTLSNKTEKTQMYYAWQMQDIISVYSVGTDSQISPMSTVISARMPLIFDGPYDPQAMPAPPKTLEITQDDTELIARLRGHLPPVPKAR